MTCPVSENRHCWERRGLDGATTRQNVYRGLFGRPVKFITTDDAR